MILKAKKVRDAMGIFQNNPGWWGMMVLQFYRFSIFDYLYIYMYIIIYLSIYTVYI